MRRSSFLLVFACTLPLIACTHLHMAKMQAAAKEADLVDMSEFAPSIALDIRYATPNNFTKQQVYAAPRCLLRREVAKRVQEVQAALAQQGKGLKLFDCYRPPAAQQKFWELVPDERYVSNPAKGSRHTKGTAVDLTIIDAQGNELEMPSAFDDFTQRAHREGNGASEAAQANMKLLETLMLKQGFEPLPTEWWHFDLQGWRDYSDINIDL